MSQRQVRFDLRNDNRGKGQVLVEARDLLIGC